MRGAFLIWMCLTVMPALAAAQVSGVIADTLLKRGVPGAVVTLLDPSRRVIGRALADDSGHFRMESAPEGTRIRIVKIGYRPAELPVSPIRASSRRADEPF